MNFLAELRKRNVFRVTAAYLVGAWVVLQVVGLIAGATGLPDWTDTMVLVVLIAGFPLVAIAAWALELTPDGVKQTKSTGDLKAKPLGAADYILLAAVAIVAGVFTWQAVSGPGIMPPAELTENVTTDQSIAVLPFVAISDDQSDVYLGDGLAEELLNVLAQFPDLRVAGRTSSFSFRGEADDIPAIGAALGVAHVLEGSVRRAGDQVRITAQLIRARDGFHIWSGTYDRPFAGVLEVQDDIVRQIAQVLTIRLGVSAMPTSATQSANTSAYEQYLRGRYFFAERHAAGNRQAAVTAFQTATDIDPDFADAWGGLARAVAYSVARLGGDFATLYRRSNEAALRALELDPNNAEARVALAYLALRDTRDWSESASQIEQALALAPSAAYVHYQSAIHYQYIGDRDRAAAAYRRALALDPLNLTIRENAIEDFLRMGMPAEAQLLADFPGVSVEDRLAARRQVALLQQDDQALEDIYQDWLTLVAEEEPDVFTTFNDYLYRVTIAGLQGDEQRLATLVPEAIAFINEQLPGDGYGWSGYVYFMAGDYSNAAHFTNLWEGQGVQDNSVFVVWDTGPPEYRCQPAYRELWQRPGMPELAELRRANGATANLPLSGPECEEFLEAAE